MKLEIYGKTIRFGKVWRLRVLLLLLVAGTVVLLTVNLLDLIHLWREHGSWTAVWAGSGQVGSRASSLLTSGVFHLFLLFIGWSAWFRLRRRELDQLRVRRSEQKYRNIINHAGEAIFLLDASGRVREWNKAAERLFGVPRRNVLGKPFQEIHLCYGIEVEKAMEDTGRSQRSLTFEFPFPRGGNRRGQLSLTISPVAGGSGPADLPPTFVVIARDITSEKQLETKMSETEKLAGIGQLAAGIAHQLNTPLGSILLSAQMLEENVPSDDEAEDVRRIIRQTEQCRTIIKGLLNFARPSGSERTRIVLADVVRETVYLMEKTLKLAGVEVNIREECDADVHGNRNELDQVFFNLLANAVDAMPRGGEIDIEFRDGAPGEVEVAFRDSGEGIPTEHQDRVFLPFFTTKEYGKGTGLGLSIVARIVHEHGGRIVMHSRPGSGTTFVLSFPRPRRRTAVGDETAPAARAAPEADGDRTGAPPSGGEAAAGQRAATREPGPARDGPQRKEGEREAGTGERRDSRRRARRET